MRKSDDPGTPSSDDAQRAENFSKYFVDKIEQISKMFSSAPDSDFSSHSGNTFNAIQVTATKDIEDLIAAAPNKHCSLDQVPTSPVKNCASLLYTISVSSFQQITRWWFANRCHSKTAVEEMRSR